MYGVAGSYRRAVILLHEIYSGTLIENNHAVGTLYAKRGATVAYHRQEVAEIRTGSAYNGTTGQLTSLSSDSLKWRLVTVVYNGRTYMAVDIPYADAHVTNFVFDGLIASTAPESLLYIDYYDTQNNVPLNTEINSSIATFTPVGKEYKDVEAFIVSGTIETTSGGVKYPDGTVQTTAAGSGMQMKKGTIGSCAPGSSGSSGSVTFPDAFPGAPIVQLTVVELDNTGCTSARISAISATGFSWVAYVGGTLSGCDCIYWTAFY
jgi:hypothetical protein